MGDDEKWESRKRILKYTVAKPDGTDNLGQRLERYDKLAKMTKGKREEKAPEAKKEEAKGKKKEETAPEKKLAKVRM